MPAGVCLKLWGYHLLAMVTHGHPHHHGFFLIVECPVFNCIGFFHNWAASKTWLQRCSNPKVLSPLLSPRFRGQGFHFRDPLLLSPAFAATFAVFRRKVLLFIMVVTSTYTCSLSRRLSRLFILKALSRSFRQAFARGVLAYAQHKHINVYLKPLHKGFWCCSIRYTVYGFPVK